MCRTCDALASKQTNKKKNKERCTQNADQITLDSIFCFLNSSLNHSHRVCRALIKEITAGPKNSFNKPFGLFAILVFLGLAKFKSRSLHGRRARNADEPNGDGRGQERDQRHVEPTAQRRRLPYPTLRH